MTQRQIAKAVRLYKRGSTLRAIADQLGVDSKTVWRALHGQVELRRRGPQGRLDVTDELIVGLRGADRLSWPAIAREVEMSRTGVRARYLRATTGERWR